MIPKKELNQIRALTLEYWTHAVSEAAFRGLAAGKEIGHRIADHVDEETTALLKKHFKCVAQTKSDGSDMPRSMGDVWIYANEMYNPINVKSGEGGKKGQPNMVSLKKLLSALVRRQIDSYYLLIIKVHADGDALVAAVYLVDLLDYLEFAVFDSGPGQIMLREQQFYDAVDAGYEPPARSLEEKINGLLRMLEDADERLIRNRLRKLEALRKDVDAYFKSSTKEIDQSTLHLK